MSGSPEQEQEEDRRGEGKGSGRDDDDDPADGFEDGADSQQVDDAQATLAEIESQAGVVEEGGTESDQSGGITDPDRTVEYIDPEELGLNTDAFESDAVKAGELGDGTTVIWKSHNDGPHTQDWKEGIIRNEVAWSKTAEELGWDIAPKSRITTAETATGETEGTMQEFVAGKQAKEAVYTGFGSRSDFDQTRPQFLSENMDWVAKTNAVDYLIGNDDRHFNNIRITPDGDPRGIDNGGNQFNEDLRGEDLTFSSDLLQYYGDNQDELYEQNQAMLNRTEALLDEIAEDDELRQSIITTVRETHGDGSREAFRISKILGDDVGEGHMLETDSRDTPAYKLHIEAARNRHERVYNGGEFFDREEDIVRMGSDDSETTTESQDTSDSSEDFNTDIDKELNNLIGDT